MKTILIDSFVVVSQNDSFKEPVSKILLSPKVGERFEFVDTSDLEDFMQDLRQTFERVMPFGCEVKANATSLYAQLEEGFLSIKK